MAHAARTRWALAGAAALALVLALGPTVEAHVRAAGVLARFDGGEAAARAAALGRRPVEVEEASIPGVGRVRLYVPTRPADAPGVLVVHGVHPRGIEVKRLVAFARALAEAGVVVATPELAELTRYRMSPASVEDVGEAAAWLAARTGRSAVGVVGISFAGGLALLAAAEGAHRDAIGWVVALGGHHDVRRLARWYVGRPVRGPAGERPAVDAHPYGAGILVERYVDRLVPPGDVAPAREALHALLLGDRDVARARLAPLSAPGRATMTAVVDRTDDTRLGALLLDAVAADAEAVAAVSPAGRLAGLHVPVFLVHGAGDPVVPATETRWLAREVPPGRLEAAVVTPLFRHAELDRAPDPRDALAVVHVLAEMLRQADLFPRRG